MNAQGVSARLARLALSTRSEQHALFGSGVSAPDGWDLILILYLADADGRRLTVEEAVAQLGGCPESGKRRVAHLSRMGVVVGDGDGQPGDIVTLAPEAVSKVEDLIERVWAAVHQV